MATLSLYTPFDMSSLSVFYGDVTSYSSTHITISDGYNSGTYFGNFTYSAYGLSGGTVTGYDSYKGNVLQAKYSGGSFPALTVNKYLDYGDATGLLKYVLSGNDTINGSSGNDKLIAYAGDDKLYGNAGNDVLDGDIGNDELIGGDGDDILDGRSGNDVLNGGNGNDSAYYNSAIAGVMLNLWNTGSQNTVNAGFDTLTNIENLLGSNYNDTLAGNAVANNLNGGSGDDKLTGSAGNDVLIGGNGNDGLNGGDGNDILNGGSGIDWGQYWSATGGVKVNLNLINPQNTLGAGIDTLIAIENLNGTGFNDTLTGNALNNTLLGNAGNDILAGGAGGDVLSGGTGKDTFVFNTVPNTNSVDKINDFIPVDDTIKLENAVFTKLTHLGIINSAYFKVGTAAADSNDYVIYNKATGALSYDADGNGAGLAIKIAVLGTHPALSTADLIVI